MRTLPHVERALSEVNYAEDFARKETLHLGSTTDGAPV